MAVKVYQLNKYLKATKKDKRLTPEELNVLVKKAQAGNIAARNEVVLRNLGLVGRMAGRKQSYNNSVPYEDRFQQGVLGLIRSVKTFDTESGFAFSTYAMKWIQQSINRYIDDTKYVVRHPVYLSQMQSKYNNLVAEHPNETEDFYARLIARQKGISVAGVITGVRTKQSITHLDAEDEEGNLRFQLGVMDENIKYFNVDKLLSCLSYQERFILLSRIEGVTLSMLGDELALSRERIRQLEQVALFKIKTLVKLANLPK